MSAFAWLWISLAGWVVLDLMLAALWAWHRSREKRAEEVTEALRRIGEQRVREAALERDLDLAYANRARLIDAALHHFPHQRSQEDHR